MEEVELRGLEPLTSCAASHALFQLSYSPAELEFCRKVKAGSLTV